MKLLRNAAALALSAALLAGSALAITPEEAFPDRYTYPGFIDVAADAWYADAVRWAYAAGVINGVSTTAFDPESPVTREQMVTMIVRYAEKIGAVTGARDDLSQFSDGMQVSSYALAAVRWAVAVGLLRGMGNGRLEPQGTATRAEVATLLMRFASLGK